MGRSEDVMRPAAQMVWSRMAGAQRSALMLTMLALSVPALPGHAQSPAPVSDARTSSAAVAAPAPHLRGIRAIGLERQGVLLTLDVAGDYTYLPGDSGSRLLTLDLPGVTTMEPDTSHLLESTLVASHRVVGYQRERSQSFLRLEVLLKTAAAADYRRTDRGLEIRLTPATAASTVSRPGTPVSAPATGPRASR